MIKPRRISAIHARRRWPNKWPILELVKGNLGTRDTLIVAALYWAVKDLVKRMVKDAS